MAEIVFPDVALSDAVFALLTGGGSPVPHAPAVTITLAEADRRECQRCHGVVEALRVAGHVTAHVTLQEVGMSLTSDAVTCLPCGCEIRR